MSPATYKLLTDALIAFHFAFVAFVVVGGLLALCWRRVAWLHLPAVLWVIWVETSASICPLTPLENSLREKAGLLQYEGGFVDHYIRPVLYPENLTRNIQFYIAGSLLVVNVLCYGLMIYNARRRRRMQPEAEHVLPQSPVVGNTTPDNVVPR